jgi:hypothetical protein
MFGRLNLSAATMSFAGGGGGTPAPSSLRLSSLPTRDWPDTATPGTVLTAINHLPVGSSVSVFIEGYLIGEKVTCFGGNIIAAADYADLPIGDHAITIAVTHEGSTKFSETVIYKYSDGAADATCEDEADFTAAIAAAQVGSSGVYVIELDPGREWGRRCFEDGNELQLTLSGTRQVVIRSTGADRINGTQAAINLVDERVAAADGRGLVWQNIRRQHRMTGAEWRAGSYTRATALYSGGAAYEGVIRYLYCRFRLGVLSYNGINPDQTYDPADMRHVGDLVYFGSTTTGVRVYDPILKDWRTEFSSVGEHAISPAIYVGDNLPNGVLPDMTGWPAAGGVPLVVATTSGTPPAARFKAEYLGAGNPALPAGMSPGNYITAVNVDGVGSAYVGDDARFNTVWLTEAGNAGSNRTLTKQGSIATSRGGSAPMNAASPELHWGRCVFESAYRGIQLGCTSNKPRFMYECRWDAFYSDLMAWGTSTDASVQQDWNGPKLRFWFNIFGRATSYSQDQFNPHMDVLQLYSQDDGTDIAYFVDWKMNLYDAGVGSRGAAQCLFLTDSNAVPVGAVGDVFNGVIFGHFQRGGATNAVVSKWFSKWRAHRATVLGPRWSGGARPRADAIGAQAADTEILTVQTNLYLSQQIARRDFVTLPNSTTGFSAPGTYAFMDSFEKLVECYTALPGSQQEGRGALGDMEQELDWLGRSFDTDAIPVLFPFVPASDQDFGATTTSGPRQLFYGRQDKAVSVSAGVRWRKASSLAGIASATWQSDPAVLAVGEWIQVEGDAGASPMVLNRATLTVAGTDSYLDVLTKDVSPNLVMNPPAGAYSQSTNASTASETFNWLVMAAKVRTPATAPPGGTYCILNSTGSNQWDLWTTDKGHLRFRSGQTSDIYLQWDNPRAWQASQDLLFILALDLRVPTPSYNEDGTIILDDPARGAVQALVNFNEMLFRGNAIGNNLDGTKTSPVSRIGASTNIMANGAGVEVMAGWGLHHIAFHWGNDATPMPDFTQFDNAKMFSSQFIDSGDGTPGSGLVGLLGSKPKLLIRAASVADANGAAGFVNLGTYDPARAPYLRAAGTDPYL